jgi:hypothetical protein
MPPKMGKFVIKREDNCKFYGFKGYIYFSGAFIPIIKEGKAVWCTALPPFFFYPVLPKAAGFGLSSASTSAQPLAL